MISSPEIIKKYLNFYKEKGHKQIPNSPLVLQNDPTTLFTSSGMQPLVPYLLGEPHPEGKRLVNVQNCFRTNDIEEVGDNRHTTFFRMLGNWSLGDYFKKEEILWFWEFLTKELQLPKEKLYVSVFQGIDDIPKDKETTEIWKEILTSDGLIPEERIYYYSDKCNWWSRSGAPKNMPPGEPGGPSSEVFYEFSNVQHRREYGEKCHPGCDCGHFMELGNAVFMQYIKQKNGSFKPLPNKNIDFGGGLERMTAAVSNTPDIFSTDLYQNIIKAIEQVTEKDYQDKKNKSAIRIIADHLKGATYLMIDNVIPSNKEHGYILRRLLRRSAVKMHQLNEGQLDSSLFNPIISAIFKTEEKLEPQINTDNQINHVQKIVNEEINRFAKTLSNGLREVEKNLAQINEKAFDLYQSYGFPFEILEEIVKEKGKTVNQEKFQKELQKHKDLSRSASSKKFKGGLADHDEQTIKGHTATHLLHQALREILGNQIFQTGSNITVDRIRFDFSYDQKLTDEQIQKTESIVNQKIKDNLKVHFEMVPTEEAKKIGAIGLFKDIYGDISKIYFIGENTNLYSIEFCGGPHVESTGQLKSFKIIKQENLGKNQKRLYAVVG